MGHYGVQEVMKLLRLPRGAIRSLVDAGFVSPARGPRRAWQFSFQDLIVLRTAQELWAANVPQRRIMRSMKELRRHLPEAMPLSGLRIAAEADRVVVKEGASRWQVDSGQYLLAFEGDPAAGSLSVVAPAAPGKPSGAQQWLDKGITLEHAGDEGALDAYRQAVAVDPTLLDAQINLGCLLHETGRLAEAERSYRAALAACDNAPALQYNLGVLLEDMGRDAQALKAYREALRGDPGLADGHYNLALLCEKLGLAKDAIRHMAQYRKLSGRK
jgi:tetratricopeptide (TPR) repeat protein